MMRWRVPWPSISRGLPFGIFIGAIAIEPLLVAALPHVDPRWFYPIKLMVVVLALFLLRRHYNDFDATQPGPVQGPVQPVLAAAVGAAVFVLWIQLDQSWATIGQSSAFDPRAPDGGLDWPLAIARLAGSSLVVPVMEELFWRSWIMRRLDRSRYWIYPPQDVSARALVLSSLVFGLEHRLWLAGLLAGLAYGTLYRRSGNLRTPVISHAVTNLMLGVWVLATGNWQFW